MKRTIALLPGLMPGPVRCCCRPEAGVFSICTPLVLVTFYIKYLRYQSPFYQLIIEYLCLSIRLKHDCAI
jgi:hypothetical protein